MDFLQYYQSWVKGEILQAKLMLLVGAILLICLIVILRSESQILKDLSIPLGLSIIALIGYGGFVIQDRNNRLTKIETEISQKELLSIKEEEKKIEEGISTCKVTIRLWVSVMVVGVSLLFFFTQPYYKGIAIGLILLGSTLLFIDVFIDKRAKILYPIFEKMELRE